MIIFLSIENIFYSPFLKLQFLLKPGIPLYCSDILTGILLQGESNKFGGFIIFYNIRVDFQRKWIFETVKELTLTSLPKLDLRSKTTYNGSCTIGSKKEKIPNYLPETDRKSNGSSMLEILNVFVQSSFFILTMFFRYIRS